MTLPWILGYLNKLQMKCCWVCIEHDYMVNDLQKGGHLMTIEEILAGESKTVEFNGVPDKSEKYMKSSFAFSEYFWW